MSFQLIFIIILLVIIIFLMLTLAWYMDRYDEGTKMKDDFFSKTNCDRCFNSLDIRIMSWFTTETICMSCSNKEQEIKNNIKEIGDDPNDYEGCGYIPEGFLNETR